MKKLLFLAMTGLLLTTSAAYAGGKQKDCKKCDKKECTKNCCKDCHKGTCSKA